MRIRDSRVRVFNECTIGNRTGDESLLDSILSTAIPYLQKQWGFKSITSELEVTLT